MSGPTYTEELAHLRQVAAIARLRVVESGTGFDLVNEGSEGAPMHATSLVRAALCIGAALMCSVEIKAAAAVAGARYGTIAGNRAERRAKGGKP